MSRIVTLDSAVAVTGAIPLWKRILKHAFVGVDKLLVPGSRVIEIGYGDGILSCYLAQHFGWHITGYDIEESCRQEAQQHAVFYGVDDRIDFHVVAPDETWRLTGQYDGVFIKTVLYNASTMQEYAAWLDWVRSVLRADGVFINFENGRANALTQLYRRLRGRYYTDLCMYDDDIHRLYEERFDIVHAAHYGSVSQFVAPIRALYYPLAMIEERVFQRTAGNSFISAVVARNRMKAS